MQLLDETESPVAETLSPFDRAQFRVRLARLWMLPSPLVQGWDASPSFDTVAPLISLSVADLREADLERAQLPLSNMSKANLAGVRLTKANLRGVNLT